MQTSGCHMLALAVVFLRRHLACHRRGYLSWHNIKTFKLACPKLCFKREPFTSHNSRMHLRHECTLNISLVMQVLTLAITHIALVYIPISTKNISNIFCFIYCLKWWTNILQCCTGTGTFSIISMPFALRPRPVFNVPTVIIQIVPYIFYQVPSIHS